MTLRARLVLLTSGAVALAIMASSVAAWMLIQATLMGEVDQRLLERVPQLDRIAEMATTFEDRRDEGARGRLLIQGEPIGIQRVAADGRIVGGVPPGDVALELDPAERRLLETAGSGPLLRTETVEGETYRVLSAALDEGTFLRMVHPLGTLEATMARMAWLLAGVAGVGAALAGGSGWLIVRAGLRPVGRLTEAAEQVAATTDLAHRIEVHGSDRDEVARLARSVNAMLAALDSAKLQQRQLVENAGHELRTPLATLRNDLGLLLRAEQQPNKQLDREERAKLLRDLNEEAAALSHLVAEVIDLARGDIEPEPPLETDLRELVERAVARSRRLDPDVPVTVRGRSVEVPARAATLERAVANLVRNAIQVGGDAAVEVEIRQDDGWAIVRVRDRGPGIADHDMPRLFDRFYRGDAARERHGSGLGLAIVAQAAEQHNGSVTAQNRLGGGAVFTLRVPVAAFSGPELSLDS